MKLSKDFAKEFYSNARMKPLYLAKTHPMGNLNVHNLGLIYPNGRIKFSNNDAVFNYVKNKCVKALNLKTYFTIKKHLTRVKFYNTIHKEIIKNGKLQERIYKVFGERGSFEIR